MAHADNLAKAMVIAPIAGIAAAAGKFYAASKKVAHPEEDKK
jgi:formate dehydrogenase iron-sulfur subunit